MIMFSIKNKLIIGIIAATLLFAMSMNAFAADGGSAASNGSITFVGGTVDSTTSSTGTSATESTSLSTMDSSGKSPDGKLPNMGDRMKRGLSISGVVLLIIGLLILLWRRKKKEEDNEKVH